MGGATILLQCNQQISRLDIAKKNRREQDDRNRKEVNKLNTLLRISLYDMYMHENNAKTIKTVEEQLTGFYAYEPNRQWAAHSNIPIPDGVLRKKGKKEESKA